MTSHKILSYLLHLLRVSLVLYSALKCQSIQITAAKMCLFLQRDQWYLVSLVNDSPKLDFQAHLLNGVHEQSYINTVMSYAMCIDEYSNEDHCRPIWQIKHVFLQKLTHEKRWVNFIYNGMIDARPYHSEVHINYAHKKDIET